MMIANSKKLVGVLAVLCLVAPSTVTADEQPDDEQPADEKQQAQADDEQADDDGEDAEEDERPWSLGGSLQMLIGQGTFVSVANDSDFADDVHDGAGAYDRVMLGFGIDAEYVWNDLEFDAEFGFDQALTPARLGSSVEPYETRIDDIELGMGHAEGFELGDTGVSVTPSLGVDLPTSPEARTATMITDLSGDIEISRTFFNSLNLSYELGGSRTFHRFTSPVIDEEHIQSEDGDLVSRQFRAGGPEDLGGSQFAIAGINTSWSLDHNVTAAILFSPSLMMVADYGISTSWTYAVAEDDEFAHERQCAGRCASQVTAGMLMLMYEVNDNLSVLGATMNMQTPKTADNKTFNFPFWNFDRPAQNSSILLLGMQASY